jgi:hypothetical protein
MLRDLLPAEGSQIGRHHFTTLMRRTGIEAVYRRPKTSKPAPGHKNYQYPLRGLVIDRPESGLGDGHHLYPDGPRLCLSLCTDWFAHRILAWRLSITMEADLCVEALSPRLLAEAHKGHYPTLPYWPAPGQREPQDVLYHASECRRIGGAWHESCSIIDACRYPESARWKPISISPSTFCSL